MQARCQQHMPCRVVANQQTIHQVRPVEKHREREMESLGLGNGFIGI